MIQGLWKKYATKHVTALIEFLSDSAAVTYTCKRRERRSEIFSSRTQQYQNE